VRNEIGTKRNETQSTDEMKNLYRGPYIHLKSVTVGKIGLQKIQINHKNYNFTIDFGNCYGCK
jgi:hypothetical protein